MQHRRSAIATSAVLLGFLGLPAAAGERSPAQEALRRHCTGDYMAHCGEHPPGGPEVEACFRAKRLLLSPECASAIGAYQREQRATRRITQVP